MIEDININLDTINKYYYNNGIDNTLEISINSLINKIGDTLYDYKTMTLLKATLIIELLIKNSIKLQSVYKIISKKDNLIHFLQKNKSCLKTRKDYNTLQITINNKKEMENIYKKIINTHFITNIKKLLDEKYKKNSFYNNKIEQLDKEMKRLIDKYNKKNQTKDNLYICVNNEKVYIEVTPFWKIISKKIILKYSDKIILGFSNTYGNDNGFFFIEDFGIFTEESYKNWIHNLLASYLKKKDLNIIKYELENNLKLFYKMPNKYYFIFIYVTFNKYNNHVYKFIKTTLNKEYDEKKLMYEINSFKPYEEINYKVKETIYSELFGRIHYNYKEKKYIFKYDEIVFKLNISINNEIKKMIEKSESIYKNLDNIFKGIINLLNINKKNKIYMIEIDNKSYILNFKNDAFEKYKDIIIKIDDSGNIIYNNLRV